MRSSWIQDKLGTDPRQKCGKFQDTIPTFKREREREINRHVVPVHVTAVPVTRLVLPPGSLHRARGRETVCIVSVRDAEEDVPEHGGGSKGVPVASRPLEEELPMVASQGRRRTPLADLMPKSLSR